MKAKGVLYLLGLLLILVVSLASACETDQDNISQDIPVAQEYTVELVNQDTVAIFSHVTGQTYICIPGEMVEVFELDNL